jgi:hypothetical protein
MDAIIRIGESLSTFIVLAGVAALIALGAPHQSFWQPVIYVLLRSHRAQIALARLKDVPATDDRRKFFW